jgi:hypothetical protein
MAAAHEELKCCLTIRVLSTFALTALAQVKRTLYLKMALITDGVRGRATLEWNE